MASTTRPKVRATPTCETAPPLCSLTMTAPVPAKTRQNVPMNSAAYFRMDDSFQQERQRYHPTADARSIQGPGRRPAVPTGRRIMASWVTFLLKIPSRFALGGTLIALVKAAHDRQSLMKGAALASPRIMIVEDNRDAADTLQMVLGL